MALSLCYNKTNSQGKELVDHGTGLFPIACYRDDLLKDPVSWHWHDELEAIIVSKGEAIIKSGNEKYILSQGQGLFINANVMHAAWIYKSPICEFHSLVFHPRLIGGSLDSIFWQSYINPLLTNPLLKSVPLDNTCSWHLTALDNIEAAWQACVLEEFGYEFQVRSLLSQLIISLCKYQPVSIKLPSEKEARNNDRIKIMLQFIQEHYSEPITVSMIASQAMISESEYLRCFKNTISTSPIQYLKQFPIEKAAQFLLYSNEKIAHISFNCGFQDVSYFVKSFREIKGVTPSDYRNSYIPENINV